MTGALVHSACNDMARKAFKAAGRNYHAEKLAAEHERMRRYYIALYADMERARVAQVPLMIGIDLGYSVPALPRGVKGTHRAPSDEVAALTEALRMANEQNTRLMDENDRLIAAAGVKACDPIPPNESAVKLPLYQAAQWNTAVASAEREPHKLVALDGRTVLAVHEALARGVAIPDGGKPR